MPRKAFELYGMIKALAWTKVFAINDLNYNPKKRKNIERGDELRSSSPK